MHIFNGNFGPKNEDMELRGLIGWIVKISWVIFILNCIFSKYSKNLTVKWFTHFSFSAITFIDLVFRFA
ncbi:unnamed protein product [Blepharisma stoltei]|uniref:Uncharacterized protein n=1 Tax=Blepharisma stoltei TaxID=1481888 RepID=A0AAU9JE19_9CILI|nr:unnamed protein product [Blepharisma stoltei]